MDSKKRTAAVLAAAVASTIALFAVPSGDARIIAGDITGGKKAPHMEFVVLHKLHGHMGFRWPGKVEGRFSDLMQRLETDAQFITAYHSSGLKNGDVIMVTGDVLRPGAGAEFEDLGVDCQLAVHVKGKRVQVGGKCDILIVDQDGRTIDHKGIIKPVLLPPHDGWILVYDDKEDGIGIYVHEAFGLE